MNRRLTTWDVAVVGAGPAGCECARRLAEADFSVTVLEEHARPGEPLHCTGIISPPAYQAFDLPRSAVQAELKEAELTSPGGITLRVELNGAGPFVVDRREVDLSLARRAQAAGVEFCYQTRVTEVQVERSAVSIAGMRAGEPWRTTARAVVLATGAKSRLPKAAGLAAVDDVVHGAQTEVPAASPPVMRVWVGRQVAPGGFGWVVPAQEGRSRVGVLTRERPPGLGPRQALIRLSRQAFAGYGDDLPQTGMSVHPVPAVPRHPTWGDRLLSVGDAAGQVKMTTGGGVYYGLLGARIASEVLSEGLRRGRLGGAYLARYQRLWQQVLGPEQKAGQLLRKLVLSAEDETLDEIFGRAERMGLSRYLVELLDFDWHARPSLWLLLGVMGALPGDGRGLSWLRRLVG